MFGVRAWLHALPCVTRPLRLAAMEADPYAQFQRWFAKAKAAGLPEPNAMSVATLRADGFPAQRMVLMKHVSAERGVVFFTNYGSHKAQELTAHPQVSLLFHYHVLQRQIRITGTAERSTREESEAYFRTRARDSQLGAWASLQSEVLPDRATFEARFAEVEARFRGQEVPCPEFWGGIRVRPVQMEFWQGRAFRLHDRFVYDLQPDATWSITRLYP